MSSDDVLNFLNRFTEGNTPYTKRIRYSHLCSFFNFVRNNLDHRLINPCDSPMIRKRYRQRVASKWEIIEKETVDEIIFRTTKTRNRLMLELMARGGMRIGKVLKLRLRDLQDRKLILQESKSGLERIIVFIPQKVADRLREYALEVRKRPAVLIFPISYEGAQKFSRIKRLEFLDNLSTSSGSMTCIQDRIFSVTLLCSGVPGTSDPFGSMLRKDSDRIAYR